MRIPVLPNAPMQSADAVQAMGELRLRRNRALHFVENAGFDPALAVYDGSYENSQAHSALFRDHMDAMAAVLESAFPQGSSLVEVGCGKGDFLSLLEARKHFSVRGYDATYVGTHPRIEARYLTVDDHIEADVVVMRHVLEHIPGPHRFLAMLQQVFGDVPVFIEVPEYEWILEHQAFFDITYEHVNYFTPSALAALFTGPPRLQSTCFGGQYQYLLARLGSLSSGFCSRYEDAAAWEELRIADLFPIIAERMQAIEASAPNDARIFIWGAATKGCMFLVHAMSAGPALFRRIKAAVDVNPGKWNRFLPGSGVPIVSPDAFFAQVSYGDVLLVANPNYRSEIEAALRTAGLSGMHLVDL
jgi:hypothetical protein